MEENNQRIHYQRFDFQWGRRLFHITSGVLLGSAYLLYFNQLQIVQFLGLIASLIYVMEHVRIKYPRLSGLFSPIFGLLLRAEEELKESAAVPYAMATLLSILSFNKIFALMAIFTLAISDPMAAIIGITFGKHKISEHRTFEGSLTFFLCTFSIVFGLYYNLTTFSLGLIFFASLIISFLASLVELYPFKIDDNITIPLSMGIIATFISFIFNMRIG